ncbi:MAG TPA: cold shock domain-containing protein [Candidatus Bathyarchaeia archaeon]|jgi:cold shock CspA family protein
MKGRIAKFFSFKGYGFIEMAESKDDIFFHTSSYPVTSTPEVGTVVEFKVVETPKGREAKEIQIIPSTPGQAAEA